MTYGAEVLTLLSGAHLAGRIMGAKNGRRDTRSKTCPAATGRSTGERNGQRTGRALSTARQPVGLADTAGPKMR